MPDRPCVPGTKHAEIVGQVESACPTLIVLCRDPKERATVEAYFAARSQRVSIIDHITDPIVAEAHKHGTFVHQHPKQPLEVVEYRDHQVRTIHHQP